MKTGRPPSAGARFAQVRQGEQEVYFAQAVRSGFAHFSIILRKFYKN